MQLFLVVVGTTIARINIIIITSEILRKQMNSSETEIYLSQGPFHFVRNIGSQDHPEVNFKFDQAFQ